VPSGASTGEHEAMGGRVRDGDKSRYLGKGRERQPAHQWRGLQKPSMGMDATRQGELDRKMIQVDGTPNKGRLGANAILACLDGGLRGLQPCQKRCPFTGTLGGIQPGCSLSR